MVTLLLVLGVTLIIGSVMAESLRNMQRQPVRIRVEDESRERYHRR